MANGFEKTKSLIGKATGGVLAPKPITEEEGLRQDLIKVVNQFKVSGTIVRDNSTLIAEVAGDNRDLIDQLKAFSNEDILKIQEKILNRQAVTTDEANKLISVLEGGTNALDKIGVSLDVRLDKLALNFQSLINDSRIDIQSRRDIVKEFAEFASNQNVDSPALKELQDINLQELNFTEKDNKLLNDLFDQVKTDTFTVKFKSTLSGLNKNLDSAVLTQEELQGLLNKQTSSFETFGEKFKKLPQLFSQGGGAVTTGAVTTGLNTILPGLGSLAETFNISEKIGGLASVESIKKVGGGIKEKVGGLFGRRQEEAVPKQEPIETSTQQTQKAIEAIDTDQIVAENVAATKDSVSSMVRANIVSIKDASTKISDQVTDQLTDTSKDLKKDFKKNKKKAIKEARKITGSVTNHLRNIRGGLFGLFGGLLPGVVGLGGGIVKTVTGFLGLVPKLLGGVLGGGLKVAGGLLTSGTAATVGAVAAAGGAGFGIGSLIDKFVIAPAQEKFQLAEAERENEIERLLSEGVGEKELKGKFDVFTVARVKKRREENAKFVEEAERVKTIRLKKRKLQSEAVKKESAKTQEVQTEDEKKTTQISKVRPPTAIVSIEPTLKPKTTAKSAQAKVSLTQTAVQPTPDQGQDILSLIDVQKGKKVEETGSVDLRLTSKNSALIKKIVTSFPSVEQKVIQPNVSPPTFEQTQAAKRQGIPTDEVDRRTPIVTFSGLPISVVKKIEAISQVETKPDIVQKDVPATVVKASTDLVTNGAQAIVVDAKQEQFKKKPSGVSKLKDISKDVPKVVPTPDQGQDILSLIDKQVVKKEKLEPTASVNIRLLPKNQALIKKIVTSFPGVKQEVVSPDKPKPTFEQIKAAERQGIPIAEIDERTPFVTFFGLPSKIVKAIESRPKAQGISTEPVTSTQGIIQSQQPSLDVRDEQLQSTASAVKAVTQPLKTSSIDEGGLTTETPVSLDNRARNLEVEKQVQDTARQAEASEAKPVAVVPSTIREQPVKQLDRKLAVDDFGLAFINSVLFG